MQPDENFIDHKNSRLYYYRTGEGTPLLLFHGFGQDHTAFNDWIAPLSGRYRIFAFDLFFHGKSQWPATTPVEKKDWTILMSRFFEKEGIDTIELAGYSLGGKFALATAEAFPEKVKRLILLAPDGIKTSFWYSLATYPFAIRSLFRSMVLHPDRFYALVNFLGWAGLADKGLLRFAGSQMDTEEKRERVYSSWVYFRHLRFNMKKMAAILNARPVPLTMITGKYDKVIMTKHMNELVGLVRLKKAYVVESGHNELLKKSIEVISQNVR